MKIETLKERIEKAETKLSKKYITIDKKTKSIQKKSDSLKKAYGIDHETFDMYNYELRVQIGGSVKAGDKIYWDLCDIDTLKSDIKRIRREIPEIEKTIDKYKKQLAGEIERESIFIKEVPEAMKELEEELIKEWDEWDIKRREKLNKHYKEVGYHAFFHGNEHYGALTRTDYEFMFKTDEQIHEDNMMIARQEVLDLYIRVKNVTGEVTDWSGIRLENGNKFPVLTGTVTGKEGKAIVSTVEAGGYNIQRLHIRTIVQSI